MNEAGLNLGYGHVKIRTGTQYTVYPSIAFPASDSFTGLGFDRKTRQVTYQGVRYEIGEDAALLAQDPLGGKVLRRRWLNSKQYQVLRQSVIDLLAEESTKPWNLVLGVAVDHFKETEYVRQMQAAWSGTLTSSDGKSFTVEQCRIIPEPMGAYWSMILGNPDLKKQCKNTPVLVIDLGYYTTDWLTIYEHAIVPGNSSGIDMGMHTLYLDLQKHIAQFYNISLDIVQIEAMVREERPLETKNQAISFGHILGPIREKIFPKIVSELLAHLDSVRLRNAIIFVTGGGASFLLPYIQKSFPGSRVLHSANTQRDNADGYWILARVLSQPEAPDKAQGFHNLARTAPGISRREPIHGGWLQDTRTNKSVTVCLDCDDQALLEAINTLSPRAASSRLLSLCLLGFQAQSQYGFPGSISSTDLRLQPLSPSSPTQDPSHWSRRLRIPDTHPAYPLLCDPPHGLPASQAFLVLCRLGLRAKRNWLKDFSSGTPIPSSSPAPMNHQPGIETKACRRDRPG